MITINTRAEARAFLNAVLKSCKGYDRGPLSWTNTDRKFSFWVTNGKFGAQIEALGVDSTEQTTRRGVPYAAIKDLVSTLAASDKRTGYDLSEDLRAISDDDFPPLGKVMELVLAKPEISGMDLDLSQVARLAPLLELRDGTKFPAKVTVKMSGKVNDWALEVRASPDFHAVVMGTKRL